MQVGLVQSEEPGELHGPQSIGRPAAGKSEIHMAYRIGSYRLPARTEEETVTVVIVQVGHRREVYSV